MMMRTLFLHKCKANCTLEHAFQTLKISSIHIYMTIIYLIAVLYILCHFLEIILPRA